MARPTLSAHPKFHKLANRLRSRALARGALELIWESCYASGDPCIGDSVTVESVADWRGKAGELVFALTDAGFLDQEMESGKSTFTVHDLEDHAPDYVLKRWEREAKRRSEGQTLRSVRQAAAREMWKRRAVTDANVLQTDASDRRLQDSVSQLHASVPPPITDPSGFSAFPLGSGSGSDARAGSETDAISGQPPLTGYSLRQIFAEVRMQMVGGFPWQTPRVAEGKDASMAELINGDQESRADVVPSIELLFRLAKDGKAGDRSREIIKDGSFAFGAWCSQWTALRERLHGLTPKTPAPRGEPPELPRTVDMRR